MLKKLPFRAIVLITLIFNGCLKIGYFPDVFKLAKVIPIPKQGKDAKIPSSYRPNSLLSCLGKLLERVLYARVNKYADENDLIARKQFGFRPQHSTVHQLQRVVNIIKSNKRMRKSTGLLLLDIEKAFDSIWHNGLIYMLNSFGLPKYLLRILKSFVTARKFAVTVGKSTSSSRNIPAGLPQGSVLSPLLYCLYISDFVSPKCCKMSYYADDTGIIAEGKQTKSIVKNSNEV